MTQAATAERERPPQQQEMPFAVVNGTAMTDLPKDLYIPPDALEVFLETFEGPLDLLLYLIKRQNLDILDIPIAEITRQYMSYIHLMKDMRLALAAEYLVMAAMLAEIKSRLLLPRPIELREEEDPRAELIRRLQEYERYKQAAGDIEILPHVGREIFLVSAEPPMHEVIKAPPHITLHEVLLAFKEVLLRADLFTHHHVQREPLSVRERMSNVLNALRPGHFVVFTDLFTVQEGRRGVVVTLLAVLELIKEGLIELMQNEAFGPLYVKSPAPMDTDEVAAHAAH